MFSSQNSGGGQFFRFLSSGVANTLAGFAVIFVLMMLGMRPILANVAGYMVGLGLSFMLSRRFVFSSTGTKRAEAIRFLIAFAIAFAVNLAVLQVLLGQLIHPGAAQVLAAATYTIAMFLLSRWFVFRRNPPVRM